MIYLTAPTTQHAWEKINEYLFLNADKLPESGIRVSSQLIAYNVVIDINKAWIDPEFVLQNSSGTTCKNGPVL